jgi:hypothetical protein
MRREADGGAGYVANDDQLATAIQSTVVGGPAAGCRAIDLRVFRGIDIRLLPDRGCDIGAAWYLGTPLAWISAVGECAPLPAPTGEAWQRAFGGGLMTTCGLRNVGAPSEGVGLHGEFSHQRAEIVAVGRDRLQDGRLVLEVRARVREASALAWHLDVLRTVRTYSEEGLVEVIDVTRNLGPDPEPAPVLYHVNLGAPLWSKGARLSIDGHIEALPRDAQARAGLGTWDVPPSAEVAPERVFEHRYRADRHGWGRATLGNADVGIELALSWNAAGLPRVHQWVHPSPGVYALALEPANSSVLGRAHDRAAGTLPVLLPGEERVTQLTILARHLTAPGE